MRLRLLSYNIKFGGRGRAEQLAAIINAANADVVMLQEATDRSVVQRLASLTGLQHWDSRSNYSTGFLTRLPVESSTWFTPRGARHAVLNLSIASPDIRIFGLHLSAWFSNWSERRRRSEIRAMIEAIREHQDGVHLIAGDFNALAPGEVLQVGRMPAWIQGMVWLSGRDIARHTIQYMLDQGYMDAWRVLHETEGYTFPAWDPHVRLDYVFAPARYRSALVDCQVFNAGPDAKTASDHFPLLLDFEVPGGS